MKEKLEAEYLNSILHALSTGGLDVDREVTVGSSTSDAYVRSPSGTSAVIELKMWEPSPANLKRARNFAGHLKDLSGADGAFLFLPGLAQSAPSSGIFSADEPIDFVDYFLSLKPPEKSRKKPRVRKPPDQSVFVAMPFKPKYDDTYLVAIQPAALAAGALSVRIDHAQFTGDIVQEIHQQIGKCRAVVADLSESRPNVLYEIGVAQALNRPIVQICSTDLQKLPFDIRNNKTIEYGIGQTSSLKTKLLRALKQAVK